MSERLAHEKTGASGLKDGDWASSIYVSCLPRLHCRSKAIHVTLDADT
jgi:hypothetical protein